MTAFHSFVFLSCDEPSLDGSIPNLFPILLNRPLNDAIVLPQKLRPIDVSGTKVKQIKFIRFRIVGKIGRIGVALHDSHFKQLCKSQLHDSPADLIFQLLRIFTIFLLYIFHFDALEIFHRENLPSGEFMEYFRNSVEPRLVRMECSFQCFPIFLL